MVAAPKKSKKQEKPRTLKGETVWMTQITSFVDDHKCRSGSWSHNRTPRLFATKKAAEEHLAGELAEELMWKEDEDDERWKEVMKKMNPKTGKLRKKYALDLDVVGDLLQPFIEGEFVETKLDWSIEELEVE